MDVAQPSFSDPGHFELSPSKLDDQACPLGGDLRLGASRQYVDEHPDGAFAASGRSPGRLFDVVIRILHNIIILHCHVEVLYFAEH